MYWWIFSQALRRSLVWSVFFSQLRLAKDHNCPHVPNIAQRWHFCEDGCWPETWSSNPLLFSESWSSNPYLVSELFLELVGPSKSICGPTNKSSYGYWLVFLIFCWPCNPGQQFRTLCFNKPKGSVWTFISHCWRQEEVGTQRLSCLHGLTFVIWISLSAFDQAVWVSLFILADSFPAVAYARRASFN